MTGTVFNIQSYSLHDGPGIRTVVFLKGCPLRCRWCSNPESQRPEPEIGFDRSKCIHNKGCDWCEGRCPSQALQNGTLRFRQCSNCLSCASACPSGALSIHGRALTVDEVIEAAERERPFYRHGGGGITLSGGEPMTQAEFAIAVLQKAKEHRLHTAMETCGFCGWDELRRAAQHLDYILYDIKLLDEEAHRKYTGVSNRRILENLSRLFAEFPDLPKRIRTPVIPSVNDNPEEIGAILKFLSPYENYTYELLPYHRFGQGKYAMLGREYPELPERLDEKTFAALQALIQK